MASKEKVLEFIEATEIIKQYMPIMEIMNIQIISDIENEALSTEIKNIEERILELQMEKVTEFLTTVYGEILSNREIDELIVLYSSPIYKRMIGLAPKTFERAVKYFTSIQDEFTEEIVKLLDADDNKDEKNL